MNIVLSITRKGSENQGQGTTLQIQLENDVTLSQARSLAKQLKQHAAPNLNVVINTEEEIIQIK